MRIGIASEHGGFVLKTAIVSKLGGAEHEIFDFGAPLLNRAGTIQTS
jgi:ribose 5-phosphate isomerase RpiB